MNGDHQSVPSGGGLEDIVASAQAAATSIWARAGDIGVARLDAAGRLVAAAGGIRHVLAHEAVVAATRTRFGDDLGRGDVVVHNDPASGGTALPDLSVVTVAGDEGQRSFGVARLRLPDVGGGEPGGIFAAARQLIQEGDRVPPVRIAEGGRILPDIVRRLAVNTRRRGAYEHDLAILRQAAFAAAQVEIHSSPWSAGGLVPERTTGSASVTVRGDLIRMPRTIRVTVATRSGGLDVDFDGTDASDPGPGNIPWTVTRTAALEALGAAVGWQGPAEALARLVNWSAPQGTFVRPAHPAACSAGGLYSGFAVREAVARALADMGLARVAWPTWTGGATLSGPPEADYRVLLGLDAPGALDDLPGLVPELRVEVMAAATWGHEVRITGPVDGDLRLTTWLVEIDGEGPAAARTGLVRAALPATIWLSATPIPDNGPNVGRRSAIRRSTHAA